MKLNFQENLLSNHSNLMVPLGVLSPPLSFFNLLPILLLKMNIKKEKKGYMSSKLTRI